MSTIWAGTGATHCDPADSRQSVRLSDPAEIDLHIYRGDTGLFQVHLIYPDGNPIDISTATWDCDIRASTDAATPLASLTVTPIDVNTVELMLDAATSQLLTSGLVWDLEMRFVGADGPLVQTLIRGVVYVEKDVSRP